MLHESGQIGVAIVFSVFALTMLSMNGYLHGARQLRDCATAAFNLNALGQVTALSNTVSTTTLSQFNNMSYDAVGNRVAVTAAISSVSSLSGSIAYSYDSKDRLLSEVSGLSGGFTNSFAYDTAGNPTTFRGASRSYNSDNQLSATGFGYDGNGNPTDYNGTGVTFDANNKATAFGSVMAAGYRADGLRAWKQNGGTSAYTYFLYDGGVPILEINGSGTVTAVNTWGPNGLISRYSGGSSVFYNFDERGNTAQRMNASGTIVSYRAADSFGATSGSPATGDPYDGFGAQWGYYKDSETGLTLCGRRYYDPNIGRWVTRDPIGTAGGVNLYAYCQSNPVNATDSSGLAAIIDISKPGYQYGNYEHSFLHFNKACNGKQNIGLYHQGGDGFLGGVIGIVGAPGIFNPPNWQGNPSIGGNDPLYNPNNPNNVHTGNSNDDPAFESYLCACVSKSMADPPQYNFSPGGYVCGSWSHEMWDCAKNERDYQHSLKAPYPGPFNSWEQANGIGIY